MATFIKCPKAVSDLALEILCEFPTHKPLLDAKAQIAYVFAHGERDEDGNVVTPALKKNGVVALGIAKILGLKDRALGRGDAEVSIDGDWWEKASDEERRALLDHELHHFAVKASVQGVIETDDLNRPKLRIRKHDFEFGWFAIIAERHGESSLERQQAQSIMDAAGQLFWPEIAK